MLALETVAGIRNDHFRDKVPIKAIVRKRRVFRNTVRKAVREGPEAFVRPCRRESLEMLVDAHNRAFAFFGGSCRRGIHDNMRAAVRKIRRGGERDWNERFLAMCGHHPVEPSACNPRLEAMCLEDAGRRRHPDTKGRSVLEAFEEERSSLAPFRGGVRILPGGADLGDVDLPRALRRESMQRPRRRSGAGGRDSRPAGPDRDPSRRDDGRGARPQLR